MGASRRALVIGGAAALATGCSTGQTTANPPTSDTPTPKPVESTTTVTVASKARGRAVKVITMAPDGHAPGGLPKCVALHGRGGDANWMVSLGVQKFLTEVVRAGVPPFAVISVDGGQETYWVDGKPGDDPQRMLLTELGSIQAAFGISMGAFGALRFTRTRKDLKAVAAISPALFRDWPNAKAKRVFADQAHWEANEPLRHVDEIAGVPLGVWCGASDPFITVARALAGRARAAISSFTPGAHDESYWAGVLPEVLSFVGKRISGTA
ncbi:hypothetical protein ALI144C_48310 [Actinosynnema sp. ALI-1.44]|uniref:alpha/beta hydrolase n=1 Tax=Actinosynnema sp. ALI-1.44 TaxID=1933779 RepID=UPI00097C2CA2|nr:hypothetical protein [Actinosynnema sp. ALI-1.44]ONI70458.1 hypothetical protein ALI144C_48310 [Actinosynnema sp. ALI-1.44]